MNPASDATSTRYAIGKISSIAPFFPRANTIPRADKGSSAAGTAVTNKMPFASATMVLAAAVSDSGLAPAKVEFLANGLKLGEATRAPYTLTWSNAVGASSYNIKRGTGTGGPYTLIGTSILTNYVDSTVSNGVTYYYVVSALNSAVEGPNAIEANATPKADPTFTHASSSG